MNEKDNVLLRSVTHGDIDLLFEWVNDDTVRKSAFHSEPISYNEHKAWFTHMLEDESVLSFLLVVNGKPVGQTRVEIDGTIGEIDYSICTEERGRGYAKKMLRLLAEKLCAERPDVQRLRAKVKSENVASRHIFSTLHYAESYVCYELSLNRVRRGGALYIRFVHDKRTAARGAA